MAAITTKRPLTLEDFNALPVGPPYYEFEEGEIILVASPTIDHQDILVEMGGETRRFVRQNQLGRVFIEVDVYLPDGRVYVPDFGFVAPDHLAMIEDDGKIHGAPDLVVEITSQDTQRDRVHKLRVYHANGVLWYWIVDQETLTIEEYRWEEAGYRLHTSVAAGETFRPALFPGLEINLAERLG